jgi:hypothetical protein
MIMVFSVFIFVSPFVILQVLFPVDDVADKGRRWAKLECVGRFAQVSDNAGGMKKLRLVYGCWIEPSGESGNQKVKRHGHR